MPKVKIRDRPALERALEVLRDAIVKKDEGNYGFSVDVEEEIARSQVDCLVNLGADFPQQTLSRLVFSALLAWAAEIEQDEEADIVELFFRKLQAKLAEAEAQRSQYSVLVFLNGQESDLKRLLESDTSEPQVRVLGWGDLENLKESELWKQVREHSRARTQLSWLISDSNQPSVKLRTLTPAVAEIITYDESAAVEIIESRIDLFRAILNWETTPSFTLLQYPARELAIFLPTPIFGVFDVAGDFLNFYYTAQSYKYQPKKLNEEKIEAACNDFQRLHAINEFDSSKVFLRTIRLYQDALDQPIPEAAFLAMWRAVESAVDPLSRGMATKSIVGRAKNLLEVNEIFGDLLVSIGNQRNALVHTGVSLSDNQRMLFSLKLVVDAMLSRLLTLSERFQGRNHLEYYFSLASKNNTSLYAMRDVINQMIKQRQKE